MRNTTRLSFVRTDSKLIKEMIENYSDKLFDGLPNIASKFDSEDTIFSAKSRISEVNYRLDIVRQLNIAYIESIIGFSSIDINNEVIFEAAERYAIDNGNKLRNMSMEDFLYCESSQEMKDYIIKNTFCISYSNSSSDIFFFSNDEEVYKIYLTSNKHYD